MKNLYARLVAGENPRTEALADLLERILAGDRKRNTKRFGDFVSQVLLADATDEEEKAHFVRWINESATVLSVVTQFRIDGGTVPDMVILNGRDPVCVVEVKIDAAIGKNQLEEYGNWLAARAGARHKRALVLLSHVTPAPPRFTDRGSKSFGVELRSVASWNTAAEWFAELCLEEDSVDEPLKSLAGEFGEFLKEDAMPTLDDAAIARQYLAQSQRKLSQAVENMQAGYRFPQDWSRGRVVTGAVGIWKYLYPEQDRISRYVYCGLCFKPTAENDDALHGYVRYENGSINDPKPVVIGDGFYAFVCIFATAKDCRYVPGFSKNRWYERKDGKLVRSESLRMVDSTGWWHYSVVGGARAGYARICPLQDLLDGDGRIGAELKHWTHGDLRKTVSLWNALFK